MIISSPGRICLFGEHQDYLGLPVIASAISLRLSIEANKRDDLQVHVKLPDVGSEERFSIEGDLVYSKTGDYFKSGINTLRKDGFNFSNGLDATVRGRIPVQAGTSSSSAMVVSWINLLARMSDQKTDLDLKQLADLAYRAEVDEFNESGGLMDQYTSALGGVVYIESEPKIKVKKLSCNLGAFVLGDSLQKKDTQDILGKSKEKVIDIVNRIKAERRDFSFHNIFSSEISNMEFLDKHERLLITETIENRDITLEGLRLLEEKEIDSNKFGSLLNRQHAILRDTLKVSTEKIDDMLEAALSAGAVGGKINGSGGGGCMFVYAPDLLEEVVIAIEKTGGKAYVVHSDVGSSFHG